MVPMIAVGRKRGTIITRLDVTLDSCLKSLDLSVPLFRHYLSGMVDESFFLGQ